MTAWEMHTLFVLGAAASTLLLRAVLPRRVHPVSRLLIAHFGVAAIAPLVLPAVELPWLEFGVDFDSYTGIRLLFPQTLVVFLLHLRLTRGSGTPDTTVVGEAAAASLAGSSTAARATPSPASPWVRYWNGDVGLGHAFWGWWVLLGQLIELGRTFVIEALGVEPAIGEVTYWKIYGALHIPWVIANALLIVGVWRAASRRVGERHALGRRAIWARVVQASVVTSVLWIVAEVVEVGALLPEQIRRAGSIGTPPPWTLRTMRGGTEMELTGRIAEGLARHLEGELRKFPRVRVIHLDSPGGSAPEGIRLSAVVRDHHLDTLVEAGCASACSLVYVAGRTRWIGSRGRIGFHDLASLIDPPWLERIRQVRVRDAMRRTYLDAGVHGDLVTRALNIPNTTIWYPTTDELIAAGVVTRRAEPDRFALSGIGAKVGTDESTTRLAAIFPNLHLLATAYDDDYEMLLDEVEDAWADGSTEVAVRDIVQKWVADLATAELSDVAPGLVAEATGLMADAFDELATKDPGRCRSVAAGRTSQVRRLPIADLLEDRRRDLTRRVIFGRSGDFVGPNGARMAAARRDFLAAARRDLDPAVSALVTDVPPDHVPPAEICRAWATALRRALDWTPDIRLGLALRFGF